MGNAHKKSNKICCVKVDYVSKGLKNSVLYVWR